MIKVFAITGGIACGKSTVAALWSTMGLQIVDADKLSHEVMKPRTVIFRSLVKRFGKDIVDGDGTINRKMLGCLVFADPGVRQEVESLIHPEVAIKAATAFFDLESAGYPYACYDVPLLYETGLHVRYKPVVVVSAPRELQLQRLQQRNNLTANEAESRIAAQMSLEEKVKLADYVIENSSSLDELYTRAAHVLESIKKSFS